MYQEKDKLMNAYRCMFQKMKSGSGFIRNELVGMFITYVYQNCGFKTGLSRADFNLEYVFGEIPKFTVKTNGYFPPNLQIYKEIINDLTDQELVSLWYQSIASTDKVNSYDQSLYPLVSFSVQSFLQQYNR